MRHQFLQFFVIFSFFIICPPAFSDDWREQKGEHFIILYPSSVGTTWARRVLSESEKYYDTIADKIGYARYQNFWTWSNRAKILIYPDQETFTQETGQPAWSRGGAGRDSGLLRSRHIVTYKQEENFLDGVLPHEISHLILRDFIGKQHIPLWLNEGVAQLQERGKKAVANQIMRNAVQKEEYLLFSTLLTLDIRKEQDTNKVRIFYAQSVSIIDFLIQTYGSSKFGQFCRHLKNGKNLEQALRATYTSSIDSIADLQRQWVGSMRY